MSQQFSEFDRQMMAKALLLAEKGKLTTTPNPRVGCLIVNNCEIVGEGWHQWAGKAHAEVFALAEAQDKAKGATVYVTLEPCHHFGRTPPCAQALIKAGVARVVIAMQDPYLEVAGRGIEDLRAAGIQVDVGLMEEAAQFLNRGFISRVVRNRPWVMLKVAASLDGKTALNNGVSQWISSQASRADVHQLRAAQSAVLTSSGTVLADNPRLTARMEDQIVERQPVRVVLDRLLSTSPNAQIYRTEDAPTILITSVEDLAKHQPWLDRGVKVKVVPMVGSMLHLQQVMQYLAEEGINNLMIEAGKTLSGALLKQGLVDELVIYLAPICLGDKARGMFELPALTDLNDKIELELHEAKQIGSDLRLTYFTS